MIENSNFNHYKPSFVDDYGGNNNGSWPAAGGACEVDGGNNPLPLPPRDRSRPAAVASKPRHQRKHPLILPSNLTNQNRWAANCETSSTPESPLSPAIGTNGSHDVHVSSLPPAKPPRVACNLDDSYDSQIASELEALDDMDEETSNSVASTSSLYQSKDHVSCEDLLDFACDRPNSKRTRGPAQGTDSDEVNWSQSIIS